MKFVAPALVCAAASLLAIVPLSAAAPATDTNVIYACVGDFVQFVRIVKGPSECLRGEKIVEWNVVGIAGPQGPAGLPGPAGATGPAGAKGANGVAGPAGATGASGPAGAAGASGPQGPAGPVGAPGVAGANGPQGPAGATGVAGAQGLKGDTGAAGPQGPIGPVGPPGAQGLKGDAGAAGSAGVAGPAGPNGPAGPSGPTGPAGPQGPQGIPGATTLPNNLQALSTLLTRSPTSDYNAQFLDGDGGSCTLGDMVLSTNRYYGGNFTPADGSLLNISSNTAVFSLLGTRFGGDGVHTFGLPNLSAAAPAGLYYSICVQGVFPPRF